MPSPASHRALDVVRALFPVVSACTLAACAAATSGTARNADLAITHVGVVDVRQGRVIRDQTVLITDGLIARIGPTSRATATPASATIDATGRYLIPGLLDMHAHMRGGRLPAWISTDWFMPLYIAHGVTGVRDMTSDCERPAAGLTCIEQMLAWRAEIERGSLLGPRLLSLSSPTLNSPNGRDFSEEEARATVRRARDRGADFLKIYAFLRPQSFAWVMDEAQKLGIGAAGHVPLRLTAREASDAGFKSVEHARDLLFDCFPGSNAFRRTAESQNPPLTVMRSMVDDHSATACGETLRTFARNGTSYVPTHLTRRMEASASDSAYRHDPRGRYVPSLFMRDWIADADNTVKRFPQPAGTRVYEDFYRKGLELTGAAHRAGVRILVGTDGGDSFVYPGSSVHDEILELVAAGLSPAEALEAATWNGAEFLGITDRYGSVETGKRADLVLLDANPLDDAANVRKVHAVVFRGALFDRARLDALMQQALTAAQRPIVLSGE